MPSSTRPTLDLSLYLVTQREALPSGKSFESSLEESLEGGVTVVQLREKHADTSSFFSIAQSAKAICDKYQRPLIINDRIDIALAVQAAGVHVGQDDMPASLARKMLGQNFYIGVSANTKEEARKAVDDGADYVGIGPCYVTRSKSDIKGVLGPQGVGEVLDEIAADDIGVVTIGGISVSNVLRVLHGSVGPITGRGIDGIATISAIVRENDARTAASKLALQIKDFKSFLTQTKPAASLDAPRIVREVASLLQKIKKTSPVIQQITNNVVKNDSANVTLALGASPIMSESPLEAEDLSKVIGSLLINLGTLNPEQIEAMGSAGAFANQNRRPVIFDPVGGGATELRKSTTKDLLQKWHPTIIKGNASEIATLAGEKGIISRGVDSGSGLKDPAKVASLLARKEHCIVVLTGPTDFVSNGRATLKVQNGHPYLGAITGSGCAAGSCIASFSAVTDFGTGPNVLPVNDNFLTSAIGGLLSLEIAAELAAERQDVKGPGTFRAALIDEIYSLQPEVIIARAKVTMVL